MTMRCALMLTLMLAGVPRIAAAAMPAQADPDWPCQQIKVPELSVGTMWNGPTLDPVMRTWSQDSDVAALVRQIAPRRIPVEQAQAEITAFAQRAGPTRQQRLTMLMAGLFDTLGQERASVMAGLDRYGRRQRAFADEIRADNAALQARQSDKAADPSKLAQEVAQLNLELRVFEDRRQTLSYACNVPTTIEQRLFALAQTIQQAMGGG